MGSPVLTLCGLKLKTTGKLSRTYKGCWNDVCVCAQSARHNGIVLLKTECFIQSVSGETTNCSVYTSGGVTDMRYYCEGSTGCEQAAPRSAVVSVQQDVALDYLSVIICHTYPSAVGEGHDIPLCYKAISLLWAWGCCDTNVTTPKAAAVSSRCGRFSTTEISCQ